MDTNEWEEYVPCSRLKTIRRKRRLQKEDADKNLLKLYKKRDKIWEAIDDLGYIELIPPIQRGWKRNFTLRNDLELSPNATFFQGILKKINNVKYSHRRDFKIIKKRKGKKVYLETPQVLSRLTDYEYRKLDDKEKVWFKEDWGFDHKGRIILWGYAFTEPWRFVLKTEPNIITMVKIFDPILLKQKAEIENYLDRRNLFPRLLKLLDGYYENPDRWNLKEKEKYKLDAIASEELKVRYYNKENEYK